MLVLIDQQRLYDIANAIRQRFNSTDRWMSSELADAILSFPAIAKPQDVSATYDEEVTFTTLASAAAIGYAAEPTVTYLPSRLYVTTATRG